MNDIQSGDEKENKPESVCTAPPTSLIINKAKCQAEFTDLNLFGSVQFLLKFHQLMKYSLPVAQHQIHHLDMARVQFVLGCRCTFQL
jgi:hypothetical protein